MPIFFSVMDTVIHVRDCIGRLDPILEIFVYKEMGSLETGLYNTPGKATL